MDDFGSLSVESPSLEKWIYQQLIAGKPVEFIADELLKSWQKENIPIAQKFTTCRFCIANNFVAPLLRAFKRDLKNGIPLPWPYLIEIFQRTNLISKTLTDAVLVGATMDKQLPLTAAHALWLNLPDPRWGRVHTEDMESIKSHFQTMKIELWREIADLKTAGNYAEIEIKLKSLQVLFPDDTNIETEKKELGEKLLEAYIENLRKDRRKTSRGARQEEVPQWPGLNEAVQNTRKNLNLESVYELTIGLHQMGFVEGALELLRTKKTTWAMREQLYEVDLLLELARFAEALDISQSIVNQNQHLPDIIEASLYSSAKAYFGLEDSKSALEIMRAIKSNNPDFRDADILIREWENQG